MMDTFLGNIKFNQEQQFISIHATSYDKSQAIYSEANIKSTPTELERLQIERNWQQKDEQYVRKCEPVKNMIKDLLLTLIRATLYLIICHIKTMTTELFTSLSDVCVQRYVYSIIRGN